MKQHQLRQLVTALAEEGVPQVPDLWPGVRARLPQPRSTRRSPRLAGKPTIAAAALTLLAVFVLATGSYAEVPLLRQLFGHLQPQVTAHTPLTPLNLSRTINRVTMGVDFAYTDATETVIGITLTGTSDSALHQIINQQTILTGPHGLIVHGPASAYPAGTQGGVASWLLWLPGTGVQTTHTVKLHLRQGPFTFSIPATVGHSRLLAPRQSATADGWTITLERVMLTPSTALFTLRGAGPDARVQLTAGGKTYPLYAGGFSGTAAIKQCFADHRRCPALWKNKDVDYSATAVDPAGSDGRGLEVNADRTAQWLEELNAAHGTWSITVTPDPSHTNPVFPLQGGSWSFHVTVR